MYDGQSLVVTQEPKWNRCPLSPTTVVPSRMITASIAGVARGMATATDCNPAPEVTTATGHG